MVADRQPESNRASEPTAPTETIPDQASTSHGSAGTARSASIAQSHSHTGTVSGCSAAPSSLRTRGREHG